MRIVKQVTVYAIISLLVLSVTPVSGQQDLALPNKPMSKHTYIRALNITSEGARLDITSFDTSPPSYFIVDFFLESNASTFFTERVQFEAVFRYHRTSYNGDLVATFPMRVEDSVHHTFFFPSQSKHEGRTALTLELSSVRDEVVEIEFEMTQWVYTSPQLPESLLNVTTIQIPVVKGTMEADSNSLVFRKIGEAYAFLPYINTTYAKLNMTLLFTISGTDDSRVRIAMNNLREASVGNAEGNQTYQADLPLADYVKLDVHHEGAAATVDIHSLLITIPEDLFALQEELHNPVTATILGFALLILSITFVSRVEFNLKEVHKDDDF